jgi:hypothetical protein
MRSTRSKYQRNALEPIVLPRKATNTFQLVETLKGYDFEGGNVIFLSLVAAVAFPFGGDVISSP